jgi:hypothetical protein
VILSATDEHVCPLLHTTSRVDDRAGKRADIAAAAAFPRREAVQRRVSTQNVPTQLREDLNAMAGTLVQLRNLTG